MARNGYYSRTAIVRVQDNYVTQWADPNENDPAHTLPLGDARAILPAEFTIPLRGLPINRLEDVDGWVPVTGWLDGAGGSHPQSSGSVVCLPPGAHQRLQSEHPGASCGRGENMMVSRGAHWMDGLNYSSTYAKGR